MKRKPGKVVVRRAVNERVRFIITQHHVVVRALRLNEALLQQQRFGFTGGDCSGDGLFHL